LFFFLSLLKFTRTLYIATIEKGHLILSSLIEENRLHEIGLIVIDELHMIGDGSSRGAILEALIVKVKLAKQQRMTDRLRMIGMSATLSNLNDISRFFDADVVQRDFRPVELIQYVKYGDKMYQYMEKGADENLFQAVRTIAPSKRTNDPENLKALVEEVLPHSPTLIFAATKSRCENIAAMLSETLSKQLYDHQREKKVALLRDLSIVNSGQICPIMKKAIPFGISYHHSGLTSDERELIESAFLEHTICCIICTSTLAAGINLPAQRVIIRSPFTGREFLTASMYRQMCGRAGRAGMCDKPGESILIINNSEFVRCKELFKPLENVCNSSFAKDSINSVSYLILVLIHLKLVKDIESTKVAVTEQTLFGVQSKPEDDFRKMVDDSFMYLQKIKLISFDEDSIFHITAMGRAAVNSMFDLDKCQRIYDELQVTQNGLNLNTNLHLIYICTFGFSESDLPYAPDRQIFFDTFMELNPEELKSAEAIGVTFGVVMNYFKFGAESLAIKRFNLTMIIYQLWQYRVEVNVVSRK
jgi:POLQ-like helicase